MAIARVFKSGDGQAVQLPPQFRLNATEVEIFRRGDEIILRERPHGMADAYALISQLPTDMFEDERLDSPPQTRSGL